MACFFTSESGSEFKHFKENCEVLNFIYIKKPVLVFCDLYFLLCVSFSVFEELRTSPKSFSWFSSNCDFKIQF